MTGIFPRRCARPTILVLIGLGVSKATLAGDFIEFSALELYWIAVMVSAPGLVLSFPILWRALSHRRALLFAVLLLWLLGLPWGVLWLVDAISPGILGRGHAYGALEYGLRVWLPGTLALVPLASVIWVGTRRRSGAD